MKLNISNDARLIIEKLNSAGFECFCVGGSVRDIIRGSINSPDDYDFTTNAKPDDIEKVFSDYITYDIGKKFGTIAVLIGDTKYEITTYRSDIDYSDNRHPDEVEFKSNIKDDLSRRDFTINAIAYNDKDGIVDYYNGLSDIENKIIKAVGDPYKRFNEDALRILRAIRFRAVLGFVIDDNTRNAIFDLRDNLLNISPERIQQELNKILCSRNVEVILKEYKDVFAVFIPELKEQFDFDQNSPHHNLNLYDHTVKTVGSIKNKLHLRLIMLLHDTGKVPTKTTKDGRSHFYGHPEKSAEIAKEILSRLKYSNKFINEACTLIKFHDLRFKGNKALIKKTMTVVGIDGIFDLYSIQLADFNAQSDFEREIKVERFEATLKAINEIIENNECFSLEQLAVNGNDIKKYLNIEDERIGLILNKLLELVIEDKLINEKEALLEFAKKQLI